MICHNTVGNLKSYVNALNDFYNFCIVQIHSIHILKEKGIIIIICAHAVAPPYAAVIQKLQLRRSSLTSRSQRYHVVSIFRNRQFLEILIFLNNFYIQLRRSSYIFRNKQFLETLVKTFVFDVKIVALSRSQTFVFDVKIVALSRSG